MVIRSRRHRKVIAGDRQRRVNGSFAAMLRLTGIGAGKVSLLLLGRIATPGVSFHRHRRCCRGGIGSRRRIVGCSRRLRAAFMTTRLALWLAGICVRHCGRRIGVLGRDDQSRAGNRCHYKDSDAQDEKVDSGLSHGSSPLFDSA